MYWAALILFTAAGAILLIMDKEDRIRSFIEDRPEIVLPTMFVVGLLFFRMRCTKPALYGSAEMVVGMVTLWFSATGPSESLLLKGIGMMGAVYVMVRGLDNLDRGLPEGRGRAFFDKAFHGKKRRSN